MPRVTQKGQVTIPRDIRLLLGIKTGDEIVFELDKGKAVLKKKSVSIHNFKKYLGFLSHLKGKKTDDVVNELRGTDRDL
jgi:AbrB family looped-hinge helix DNA binding protein